MLRTVQTYGKQAFFLCAVWLVALSSCHSRSTRHVDSPPGQELRRSPSNNLAAEEKISAVIEHLLDSTGTSGTNGPLPPRQLAYSVAVINFYRARHWQPAWCSATAVSAKGDSAFALLERTAEYGLPNHFFRVAALKQDAQFARRTPDPTARVVQLAQLEIQLTHSLLRLMACLRHGRLQPKTWNLALHPQWVQTEGLAALCRALSAQEFSRAILACQPNHWPYRQLQKAVARFVRTHPLDSTQIFVPDFRTDSSGSYRAIQHLLIQEGYYPPLADTLPLALRKKQWQEALRRFQWDNGLEADGNAGTRTRAALSRSSWDRYNQAALTLERLRWETFADSAYLLVNIPAYQLYVCRREEAEKTYRVIVGKPTTPTPALSSQLTYFVVGPEWNVPHRIATQEMLPRIKANIGYLAENQLNLYDRQNQQLNPYEIDWSQVNAANFTYFIRQSPGCDNALGNILFHFPNAYSVYLHDTPTRTLFNRTYRSLSHGCIRVEQPASIARYLLRREQTVDTLSLAHVESCQLHRQRKQVNLKYPLPIHIRYYTCWAVKEKLRFYPDIYQLDPALKQAFMRE